MSDAIVSVYSDARTEYTKQLCAFLVPAYFQFFLGLLEKAREQSQAEPRRLLWQFQTLLNDIPEWNMEKVNTEIGHLQTACGCDYLEDLLTAVFIAHTKVLTAIRVSSKQKKVQITVPKVEHFLFKVLCETSKLLWGSTYLFREDVNSMEKQQNYRSVEGLLQEGVVQAIRALVPVKSILRDFVSTDNSDSEADSSDSDEEESKKASAPAPQPEPEPEPEQEHKPESNPDFEQPLASAPEPPSAHEQTPEPAPAPEVAPEPASVQQPAPSNELVNPVEEQKPILRLDDHANVTFTGLDAMFDSEHPDGSDLIEGNLEDGIPYDDEEASGLEILDGDDDGQPLMEDDVEDLDGSGKKKGEDSFDDASGSAPDDYEVLV
jgi:hypothetical protein